MVISCSQDRKTEWTQKSQPAIDSIRIAEDWLHRANSEYEPGNRDSALKLVEIALSYRRDYPEAWHLRGNCLGSLDSFAQAKASYDEALRLRPNYANAWWHRGCMHASTGLPDSALEDLRHAIGIDSSYKSWPIQDGCWKRMLDDPRLLALTK